MAARTAAARLAPRAIASPANALRARHLAQQQQQQQHRPFFSLPDLSAAAAPQTVRARRVLPYSWIALYDIIADIDSYSRFLPYCAHSRVTSWSTPLADGGSPSPISPDTRGDSSSGGGGGGSEINGGLAEDVLRGFQARRWPTSGVLTAGWSGLNETYSSRVFCVPDLGIVEAISGDAAPSVGAADLARWGLRDQGPSSARVAGRSNDVGAGEEGTFRSLVTRWTVRPLGKGGRAVDDSGWSEVDLSIRFQFLNPLYGAVSSAVADKVAPVMVDAFEKEARRVLGSSKES